MTKRMQLPPSLWFDCAAGGVVGVAMLVLSNGIAPLFGIPRAVLLTMALVNPAYAAFSYSLARQPEAPRRHVRAQEVLARGDVQGRGKTCSPAAMCRWRGKTRCPSSNWPSTADPSRS